MANLIVTEDLAAPASIGRGGHSMYVLQWLHGLERRGHRVLFVEFLKEDPGELRQAVTRYFSETIEAWWHPRQSALIIESSMDSLYGLDAKQVAGVAREADALISLAAHYRRDPYPLVENIRPRVLLDTDPAYTHVWAAAGDARDIFGEQDIYFTVGGNIGSPRCSVPTLGIRWRPIWNPVLLDWWEIKEQPDLSFFTTVADWRSYGYFEFEGQVLGPKAEEFRNFIELPRLIDSPLQIALNIDQEDPDIDYLKGHGWKLVSPEVVSNPGLYQRFLMDSAGEFSCAKGGYVHTRSGWFSDRSACYLAAGRPVVLQSTGFEDLLPTGEGLFAVSTAEEAADAIRAIGRDYALHSKAARGLAEEFFDSDKIVGRLLAEAGITV